MAVLIPLLIVSFGEAFSCLISVLEDLENITAGNLYFAVVPTDSNTSILLAGLSEVFSVVTTVLATAMIALKIILVTRKCRARYSYAKVIEILVQSAALESLIYIIMSATDLAFFTLFGSKSANAALVAVLLEIDAYSSAMRLVIVVCVPLNPTSEKYRAD